MPGAEALVAEVAEVVAVGCLSNTNSLHTEDQFSRWGIFAKFDPRFLSHELGVLKPDRELFERVAELAGIEPGRILFLDDNVINVDGARAAGFAADHARGVASARDALVAVVCSRRRPPPAEFYAATMLGSNVIVPVAPLLTEADADAVVALCTEFGRYRIYGEHEQIEIPDGPGLAQRHDALRNFLDRAASARRRADRHARGPHELLPRGVRVRRAAAARGDRRRSCHPRLLDAARAGPRPAGHRARDRRTPT